MNTNRDYRSFTGGVFTQLKHLNEDYVSIKTGDKWSKKEILGHLCDSAINNIYRFLHLQKSGQIFEVVKYEQELWVKQAAYQSRMWDEICQLWYSLNYTILNISEQLSSQTDLRVSIEGEPTSIQSLVEDYFQHLEHHIQQILSDEKAEL